MKTFNEGDRVRHPLHGFARVLGYDETNKLVEIVPGGYGEHSVKVHPVSLMLVPEPELMFTLAVTDTDGWRATAGPYPKDQIDALLTGGFDWSTVQTVTINRAKGK